MPLPGFGVWSVECQVSSLKCEVESGKCEVGREQDLVSAQKS